MEEILIIEILIVEDNKAQVEVYSDGIEIYNESHPNINIRPTILDNYQQAIIQLRNTSFDAAIVDLNLNTHSTGDLEGNKIADDVLSNIRIPLYIISGYINDVDNKFAEFENIFFRPINKGSFEISELLDEITKIVNTGITKILNKEGVVERYINTVFRKHLHYSMPYWMNTASTQDTTNPLLRYFSSHLSEILDVSENGVLEDYHAPEFFIEKPIKRSSRTVYTGDVLLKKSTQELFFIITPLCDLATSNADSKGKSRGPKLESYVTLVKIENPIIFFESLKSDQIKSFEKNTTASGHYLPGTTTEVLKNGGIINFQNISSVMLQELLNNENYEAVLSIAPTFRKDIISRFANYYSRQGQPSLLTSQ